LICLPIEYDVPFFLKEKTYWRPSGCRIQSWRRTIHQNRPQGSIRACMKKRLPEEGTVLPPPVNNETAGLPPSLLILVCKCNDRVPGNRDRGGRLVIAVVRHVEVIAVSVHVYEPAYYELGPPGEFDVGAKIIG